MPRGVAARRTIQSLRRAAVKNRCGAPPPELPRVPGPALALGALGLGSLEVRLRRSCGAGGARATAWSLFPHVGGHFLEAPQVQPRGARRRSSPNEPDRNEHRFGTMKRSHAQCGLGAVLGLRAPRIRRESVGLLLGVMTPDRPARQGTSRAWPPRTRTSSSSPSAWTWRCHPASPPRRCTRPACLPVMLWGSTRCLGP